MIEKVERRYRIASTRMSKWNYGWNASYFATIFTEGKEPIFGHINNQQYRANSLADIAVECWQEMPYRYPFMQLDEFVVMPNHVHGIVRIKHGDGGLVTEGCKYVCSSRDAINRVSTSTPCKSSIAPYVSAGKPLLSTVANLITAYDINSPSQEQPGGITGRHNPMLHENLSRVIRWYKGRITYECRKINPNFGWQERYHEHIIRNEDSYQKIKTYIINNPLN